MAQKIIRAVVSGRVQGVCFRAYTREAALRYGVKGWVRNLPDGSVEALVSGDADPVERMIAWLHQGPPSSRVSRVTLEEIEPDEQFAAFEIRYW
ncbi:MAG: acylphosphatase [Proteobacteria bacterium]|nr:acylphosphatase [Pseudomonadota bacterium]MBU0968190.1 acylphosphatase [Pseudomonadota bacterium]